MNKKILLLGGSYGQIAAIEEANKRGLYTILCDYLADNPGQYLVDEFHRVNTTDTEKVLKLAKLKQIDYILAYCSDPAVLTSSYVSTKMGLSGNGPESVMILSNKDLFRKFQRDHGFHAPKYLVIEDSDNDIPLDQISDLLPAVVKPVDSSDTKGVTMINEMMELDHAVDYAFKFSRCGKIIIEEQVGKELADLNGDGFVIDGELKFCEMGDHIFTSIAKRYKPSSTLFPSKLDPENLQKVEKAASQIIKKSGYKFGPVNIEARINQKNEVYIMEIGPRNGGNYIPQAIHYSTGFNMLEALFDLFLKKKVTISKDIQKPTIVFTLHSNVEGIYESFEVDVDLKPYLAESHIFVQPGDHVNSFDKSRSSLGSLIFTFDTMLIAERTMETLYENVIGGLHLKC